MASPTFDVYQQVFALSMLSNRVSGYTGSQAALQLQLQYELAGYLSGVPQGAIPSGNWPAPQPTTPAAVQMGSWALEWGPAVYQSGDGSQVADNAMFVASCGDLVIPGIANTNPLTVYVVAIAATNFDSAYDWAVEDGETGTVVDFTTYNPSQVPQAAAAVNGTTPYISMATAIGVYNLVSNMTPPTGAVAAGVPLQKFLDSVAGPNTAVIFTGHSLAGALSPTIALSLKPSLSSFTEILVYPTAGATPGELNFATAFNTAFPQSAAGGSSYQQWNTLHWNFYDVVPHAWNPTILAEITTLYLNASYPHLSGNPPFLVDIWAIVQMALYHSGPSESGVTYTPLQNAPLNRANPATLQPATALIVGPVPKAGDPLPDGSPLTVPPTSVHDFILQLVTQHVYMYVGIPSFTYYAPNASTLTTTPVVPGLILPEPVVQLPQPPSLLAGVTKAPNSTVLDNIETWIENAALKWLENHLPPIAQ